MKTRAFGWTGVRAPVIGQGTWKLSDKAAAEAALRRGLALGMTHIDTAELYTGSEEVVGRAIEGRRDDVFLVSKVLPKNASYDGVKKACARSLERLGTQALDLYLLHWWSEEHSIEDTMRALGDLVDDGKTRFLGVSNLDLSELEAATEALGRHRIAANQVLYHLGDRGMEAEVLPWCKKHGVAVVGYSPFGSGRFPTPSSKGGKVLADVAGRLRKTPRQVALAFLSRDPDVFVIPKAETIQHVEENAGGAFDLPKDAVEAIDAAFPARPGLRLL
ncbi:MAG: aldo/keto reductase [Methanobacteriota archaeon]